MPMVEGLAVPPPKETVIQGTSDDGVFRQLVGVPDAVNVKLSPVERAVAELGESATEVQVWARRFEPLRDTNRTARSARKDIS